MTGNPTTIPVAKHDFSQFDMSVLAVRPVLDSEFPLNNGRVMKKDGP